MAKRTNTPRIMDITLGEAEPISDIQNDAISPVHIDELTPIQNDELTHIQNDESAPIQNGASSRMQAPESKTPRPQKAPSQPVELDPAFVGDPQRMQYALLLALLLRGKGTAKFSRADMDHVDTDYNILFARTLDGQHLEVTVVSSESGIIRSPEREKEAQWDAQRKTSLQHSTSLPFPASPESHPAAIFGPGGMTSAYPGTTPFQTPIHISNPSDQPSPTEPQQTPQWTAPTREDLFQKMVEQAQQQQTSDGPTLLNREVTPFPSPDPRVAKDGSAPYAFPFQVGDQPATVQELNLEALQQKLLQQDRQIATEEAEAIARMEKA